ncbi:MAG: DUF4065 domain-containing protein [Cyanobacteriota bacterium]|nr:DUF4065 domain-containing protein [Cyanobacteriota bacterium]
MLSCFDIANYFIWLANETGSFVSNLKLQKLVYYTQAWHLGINGTPLFDQDFEAWIHGPVIPALYDRYKSFGWKPIVQEIPKPQFSEDLHQFLQSVTDVYFACDAYELERMTYVEDPWRLARGNLPMDAPSHAIISKESMRKFFAARAEETEENLTAA